MIKNDIVLALAKTRLSSYEMQVLFAIIRKTYGFKNKDGSRKTKDWISLSQLRELTGISQDSHICRTIKLLLLKKIVTKGGNKSYLRGQIQKKHTKENTTKERGRITPQFLRELKENNKFRWLVVYKNHYN